MRVCVCGGREDVALICFGRHSSAFTARGAKGKRGVVFSRLLSVASHSRAYERVPVQTIAVSIEERGRARVRMERRGHKTAQPAEQSSS
jgi:hypothetical protein